MSVKALPSCLRLCQEPCHQNYLPKQVKLKNRGRKVMQLYTARPQIVQSSDREAVGTHVFVLSDLYTDYSENMTWLSSLSTVRHKEDVLIVAGDVAETYKNFVLTMALLKDRFKHVFYVPGNHDLWCCFNEGDQFDSLKKFNKLLDACKGLGVQTSPMVIGGLGIILLFSWYHESFDRENDITSIRIPALEMACKDFHACEWPGELRKQDTSIARYFNAMNDEHHDAIKEMKKKCSHIISFSHFLPRQELCPEKRMLLYPNLPKIIGSEYLEARVRSIHGVEGGASACHVFGHTHFCWDVVLDGIRYLQAPLAYPRERKRRMNGGEDWLPFCIYSDGKFAEKISPCYWSDYYSANPRTPDITHLAPWVARLYGRRLP